MPSTDDRYPVSGVATHRVGIQGASIQPSVTALWGLNPDSFGIGLEGEDPGRREDGHTLTISHPTGGWTHFTGSGPEVGLWASCQPEH